MTKGDKEKVERANCREMMEQGWKQREWGKSEKHPMKRIRLSVVSAAQSVTVKRRWQKFRVAPAHLSDASSD